MTKLSVGTSLSTSISSQQHNSKEEISDITQLSKEPTANQAIVLQTLSNQRFEAMYPYKGSKIHSVLGVIQDWTQSEEVWFYKVEATIVNEFDEEKKTA